MTVEFNGNKSPEGSSLREGFFSRRSNLYGRITSMIDCFVVPPRKDDLFLESVNGSGVEGQTKDLLNTNFYFLKTRYSVIIIVSPANAASPHPIKDRACGLSANVRFM
ncbi:hypothetical protein [Pedobacter psychrodurus]|uniref:hypothetical protein n=1 Tax=Pedobacter psychrodurus TaxID=2530456 RepID=UPI00103FC1BA|nr:hypothetical protein [Pedobacter psychrodurus]